jgi:hypothetical protein
VSRLARRLGCNPPECLVQIVEFSYSALFGENGLIRPGDALNEDAERLQFRNNLRSVLASYFEGGRKVRIVRPERFEGIKIHSPDSWTNLRSRHKAIPTYSTGAP